MEWGIWTLYIHGRVARFLMNPQTKTARTTIDQVLCFEVDSLWTMMTGLEGLTENGVSQPIYIGLVQMDTENDTMC
jgi:hypothetical protein